MAKKPAPGISAQGPPAADLVLPGVVASARGIGGKANPESFDADPAGLVLLGVIASAHGIRGEVKIKSFTGNPADVGAYGALTAIDGRKLELSRLRAGKDDLVIASVAGVNDRNQAEALRGLKLYIPRARLPAPAPDEYYHADLIGLAAVDAAGAVLGSVKDVLNFGAGDILEIVPPGGGESALYAFKSGTIVSVDLAGMRIVLAPPDEAE